jgi:hypothetical protein
MEQGIASKDRECGQGVWEKGGGWRDERAG